MCRRLITLVHVRVACNHVWIKQEHWHASSAARRYEWLWIANLDIRGMRIDHDSRHRTAFLSKRSVKLTTAPLQLAKWHLRIFNLAYTMVRLAIFVNLWAGAAAGTFQLSQRRMIRQKLVLSFCHSVQILLMENMSLLSRMDSWYNDHSFDFLCQSLRCRCSKQLGISQCWIRLIRKLHATSTCVKVLIHTLADS